MAGEQQKAPVKIVAEGRYVAVPTDVALTKSSEKQTRQVEAIFRITQPGSEFDGRSVGWRGFFTEATADKTFEALEAMGLKDGDVRKVAEIPKAGASVQIVVEHEDGKDKDGNTKRFARVRWVNSMGGAKIKDEHKLDKSEVDEFAREMMALYGKGSASGNGKPPVPGAAPKPKEKPAQQAPPAAEDDDIPF